MTTADAKQNDVDSAIQLIALAFMTSPELAARPAHEPEPEPEPKDWRTPEANAALAAMPMTDLILRLMIGGGKRDAT